MDWSVFAEKLAEESYKNNNSSGVNYLDDVEQVVVYDDNPRAHSNSVRDGHLEELREWLQANQLEEKGFGRYLPEYPDASQPRVFAYAMIIGATSSHVPAIANEWRRITNSD